jgi:uncharacterized protein (UPF0332 family)
MFYIAEAFLLGKGLSFSKHSGVHAGFSKLFIQTGIVPAHFHKYLVRGMGVRHVADYMTEQCVTREKAAEQISHAEEFIDLAEKLADSAR